MAFHLPGHAYLGPGTQDLTASPLDEDDVIAAEHDRAYASANSDADIRKADLAAIKEFGTSFLSGNLHSGVGLAGLGAKYIGETLVGVQYPKMPPDSNKRPRIDEGNDVSSSGDASSTAGPAVSSAREAQTGGSTPGGTGANVIATIITNPSLNNISTTFKKRFQIYTGAFSMKTVKYDFLPANLQNLFDSGTFFFVTPLACINPNYLQLYCTRAEFSYIPEFTYATSCSIKVTPLGFRLPFATNEGASTYANSQTLVQIGSGIGINKQYNMVECGYATEISDTTDPVKGELTFTPQEVLYGSNGSIGACMGVPRHWNRYTVLAKLPTSDSETETTGSPMLLNMINVQNVIDTKGMPVINYKYDFKNGFLFCNTDPNRTQRAIQSQHGSRNEGMTFMEFKAYRNTGPDGAVATAAPLPIIQGNDSYKNPTMDYNSPIEKAPYMSRQFGQSLTPDHAPLLHFGVMPVQSNPVNAPKATFANVAMIWEIETELHTTTSIGFVDSDVQRPNIKSWDPVFYTNDFTTADIDPRLASAYISGRRMNGVIGPR